MKTVLLKFEGDISEVVSEEQATRVAAVFAKYQEDKKDIVLKLNGGMRVKVSELIDMQDQEDGGTLEEQLFRIMAHNKRCSARGRLDEWIWYYLQEGKIVRTTREVMEKRVREKSKEILLKRKGVTGISERDGQLQVKLFEEVK